MFKNDDARRMFRSTTQFDDPIAQLLSLQKDLSDLIPKQKDTVHDLGSYYNRATGKQSKYYNFLVALQNICSEIAEYYQSPSKNTRKTTNGENIYPAAVFEKNIVNDLEKLRGITNIIQSKEKKMNVIEINILLERINGIMYNLGMRIELLPRLVTSTGGTKRKSRRIRRRTHRRRHSTTKHK